MLYPSGLCTKEAINIVFALKVQTFQCRNHKLWCSIGWPGTPKWFILWFQSILYIFVINRFIQKGLSSTEIYDQETTLTLKSKINLEFTKKCKLDLTRFFSVPPWGFTIQQWLWEPYFNCLVIFDTHLPQYTLKLNEILPCIW